MSRNKCSCLKSGSISFTLDMSDLTSVLLRNKMDKKSSLGDTAEEKMNKGERR